MASWQKAHTCTLHKITGGKICICASLWKTFETARPPFIKQIWTVWNKLEIKPGLIFAFCSLCCNRPAHRCTAIISIKNTWHTGLYHPADSTLNYTVSLPLHKIHTPLKQQWHKKKTCAAKRLSVQSQGFRINQGGDEWEQFWARRLTVICDQQIKLWFYWEASRCDCVSGTEGGGRAFLEMKIEPTLALHLQWTSHSSERYTDK